MTDHRCFDEADEPEPELGAAKKAGPDHDPAWRDKQIARRLTDAYRDRANIVEPALEAVEAYMSIGEMVDALSGASGARELRKRGGFINRLY